MKDLHKFISEHVMFQPMGRFLRMADIAVDTFIDAIFEQNNLPFELSKTLYKFGAFNILIPLNELMLEILPENQLSWWKQKMFVFFKDCDVLHDIQKAFHDNAFCYAAKFEFAMAYPGSFLSSEAAMMEMLWESFSADVSSLKMQGDMMAGILIPGLFVGKLEHSYLELLDQKGLPALLEILKQHDECLRTLTKYEVTTIKLFVAQYSSELGWRYVTQLPQSLRKILQYKEQDLCSLRYREYSSLVFSDSQTIDSFISVHWVVQLQALGDYVKSFALKDNSSKALRYSLPTLLHCVGQDEDASDYLITLFGELSIRGCSDEAFLLALYRAVSIERFNNRRRILAEMQRIFGAKNFSSSLLSVLQDILKFYQVLFKELPKRFKQEALQELVDATTGSDKIFYQNYQLYLEHFWDNNPVQRVKWLYDVLLVHYQLVAKLEAALEYIKDTSATYSDRIMSLHWFARVFGLLTSHIEHDIRVAGEQCLLCLAGDDISEFNNEVRMDEIFDVYSPSQYERLRVYDERLAQEMQSVPSYSTAVLFEKLDLSSDIDGIEIIQRIQHLAESDAILSQKFDRVENVSNLHNAIGTAFLSYAFSSDTQLGQAMMEAIIFDKDATLRLYQEIQRWSDTGNVKQLSFEELEILHKVSDLLEDAIYHPEHYIQVAAKKKLVGAMKDLMGAIPVVGDVVTGAVALGELKNALFDLYPCFHSGADSLPKKE